MRHRLEGRKFGREIGHRKALLRNLVKSIVEHGRIKTTHAKAKEARKMVERVITYGKKDTIHHRRLAFSVLQSKDLVKKLFEEIAPKYSTRNGGYTRVLQMGFRRGDCAPMALLELVEGGAVANTDHNIKATDLNK